MARVRVQLHYEGIGDVMRMGKVRNALRTQAVGITSRARGLSSAEGVVASIHTEDGTRPKGRPYARTVSDQAGAEFGSETVERRRLLARAAGL